MISRHNNRKTTAFRRMAALAFLCFGMAFPLWAVEVPASGPVSEKKEAPAEKSAKSSTFQIPKLFSSLRKNKAEKKEKKSEPTEKRPEPVKATSVEVKPETPVEQEKEKENSTTAPLPPDINYSKVVARSTTGGAAENAVRSKPSDNRPSLPTVQTQTAAPEKEEPKVSSLSSYSFDSRDWVEYFPVEHLQPTPPVGQGAPNSVSRNVAPNTAGHPMGHGVEKPVQNSAEKAPPITVAQKTNENVPVDPFSSNQVTEVAGARVFHRAPEKTPLTAPPARRAVEEPKTTAQFSENWDGAAMPLVSADTGIRIASSKPDEIRIVQEMNVEKTVADLKPSYASRLEHTEVCGVVVVQANFPLTGIRSILEEIKLLQRDLNLYMGVPAPQEKIELCLFKNEATYVRFLREVFPKAPRDRRALYIKLDNQPGTLLVQKTEEFEVDLRHEMTHAIIHASIRDVPIWLDEGLAKYFEVPIKDRANGNPYMKQIRRNVKFGAVPQLERLEKLEHIGQMGTREYRDSWAWVHFMIHHSPQTHRLLAGYLQVLAALPEPKSDAKGVRVPPLGLYLEDVVSSPKERYREHFRGHDD